RPIKISVTENLEKDQILGRMPQNLAPLARLVEANQADFRRVTSRETTQDEKQRSLRHLVFRRRKGVTLVEELSIRTQRIQPMMKKLKQISERMNGVREELRRIKENRGSKDDRAN